MGKIKKRSNRSVKRGKKNSDMVTGDHLVCTRTEFEELRDQINRIVQVNPIDSSLEDNFTDLKNEVYSLKGQLRNVRTLFFIVNVVFFAITLVGAHRIYEYEQFKIVRDEANENLIEQVEQKISTIMNSFSATKSSLREKERLNELERLSKSLDVLGVDSERFEGVKILHSVLESVVNGELRTAGSLVAKNKHRFQSNSFYQSRIKTLGALVPITEHRYRQTPMNKEKELEKAIESDPTNALAYNTLGIVLANRMRDRLVTTENREIGMTMEELKSELSLFRRAILNFKLAHEASNTPSSFKKYVNNKAWLELIVLRYSLKSFENDKIFLPYLVDEMGYSDINHFFDSVQSILKSQGSRTENILPSFPETKAQLYWFQAEYNRQIGINKKKLEQLQDKGFFHFKKAVEAGLYNRKKNGEKALESLNSDYLHKDIATQRPLKFKELESFVVSYQDSL